MKRMLISIILVLLQLNCERIIRPKLTETATVELEVVAGLVTDAYIRLKPLDLPANSQVMVYRDGKRWLEFNGLAGDTVLHDWGLPAGREVCYQAEVRKSGVVVGRSNEVRVALRPTTSHEVTWSVYEFESFYGTGVLQDVTIVNDKDIWVVGEIYSDDEKPFEPYNAVHWDGRNWELKRIKTNACGGVDYPPIKTVIKIDDNTLAFGHKDASITLFRNDEYVNDCSYINEINGSIWSMWGPDIKNLYIGSHDGIISRYNGNQWEKLIAVNNLYIQDIYGSNAEVLAIASDFYHRPGSELIRIEGDRAEVIADSTKILRGMAGLWFSSGEEYWLAGSGIYRARINPNSWDEIKDIPDYFAFSIAATDVNDIWVVGGYGMIIHYNGKSWYNYLEKELPKINGNYYSVAVDANQVVIVGLQLTNTGYGSKGIILMGKRR